MHVDTINVYFILVCIVVNARCQDSVYWPIPPGPGATRYSPLDDINKGNIDNVQLTWEYAYPLPKFMDQAWDYMHEGGAPIMVDNGAGRDVVISATPYRLVFAVDATTGEELWTSDVALANNNSLVPAFTRGVSTWLDPDKQDGDPCRRMVYIASNNHSVLSTLFALDAATGELCTDFGDEGGLIIHPDDDQWICPCVHQFINYPTVIGDVLTITPSNSDGISINTPRGDVPAYHARTGKEMWTFRVIPEDDSDPHMSTWLNGTGHVGGCNAWIPIGGDEELGIFYVATSSPSGDEIGTSRHGDNLYCDCVLALNATTGELIWYRQLVHHNIWDYDLNATPVITEITRNNERRKVVIQTTKMGFLFAFDAVNGEPVFDIVETPVLQSDVPGELTSPTQPFPVDDFLIVSHRYLNLTEGADLWAEDGLGMAQCLISLEGIDPIAEFYKPPTLGHGTFVIPGATGGFNVGSASIDSNRSIAVAVINDMIGVIQIMPAGSTEEQPPWCDIYRKYYDSEYWSCVTFTANRFADSIPCFAPPWAKMVAINLEEGRVMWEVPYGNMAPGDPTGQWHVTGGLLLTAGGLIFANNQWDSILRAFDVDSGQELWRPSDSPEGSFSRGNPITYRSGGRQYVLRQNKLEDSPFSGGLLKAYALP